MAKRPLINITSDIGFSIGTGPKSTERVPVKEIEIDTTVPTIFIDASKAIEMEGGLSLRGSPLAVRCNFTVREDGSNLYATIERTFGGGLKMTFPAANGVSESLLGFLTRAVDSRNPRVRIEDFTTE